MFISSYSHFILTIGSGLKRGLLGACVLVCLVALAPKVMAASIAVPTDVAKNVRDFLSVHPDVASITEYRGERLWRDEVEVVLLYQALLLGGYQEALTFQHVDEYYRILDRVKTAQAAVSGTTLWLRDISQRPELLISPAVIDQNHYFANLFARSDNIPALSVQRLEDLSEFTVASNRQWSVDWETLNQMGFKKLIHNNSSNNMVRMVMAGRIDYVLAPNFGVDSFNPDDKGTNLLPIPGIRVMLNESRHWPISAQHPQGPAISRAIEIGVKILRERGLLEKAFYDVNFFTEDQKDWKIINRLD